MITRISSVSYRDLESFEELRAQLTDAIRDAVCDFEVKREEFTDAMLEARSEAIRHELRWNAVDIIQAEAVTELIRSLRAGLSDRGPKGEEYRQPHRAIEMLEYKKKRLTEHLRRGDWSSISSSAMANLIELAESGVIGEQLEIVEDCLKAVLHTWQGKEAKLQLEAEAAEKKRREAVSADYRRLSRKAAYELKKMLREAGLPVSGKKQEKVERLMDAAHDGWREVVED